MDLPDSKNSLPEVPPFASGTQGGAANTPTILHTPTSYSSSGNDSPGGSEDSRQSRPGGFATLREPLEFGEYELLQEIARGGMGVVYKARHRKLERIVALKMILAGQFASSDGVERFRAEAQAAANLDHPGIVPIYEVGECVGRHFFAMGFVDGSSLAAVLAEGPMEPRAAAELLQHVAEAVQFAHERGIVHRDLKPANVLLDRQGQPRITDFGLAKQLAHDSHLTTSGQILGTPSYMPPEQAAGEGRKVGPHSDVYSLGAMLYAQLTGRPPFSAANPMDTLMQVLDREPVPPRTLNSRVPVDLETICLKCLQKEPSRRYGSARELAADLGRFLNGESILARPGSSLDKAVKWARRRPTVAALLSLVGVLALLGVGGISWQWWRAEVSASIARKLAKVAQDERDDAQRARDESKRDLRNSLLAQSQAGRFSGRPGRRFEGLSAVSRAVEIVGGPDVRDEAIACLALSDVRVERAIRLATPSPPGVVTAFDSSCERYALYDAQGAITIHSAKTDEALLKLPGPGMPIAWLLRFSPDGKYLAAKYEGSGKALFQVWNLQTREPAFKTTGPISIAAVDFHSTKPELALVDMSGKLRLVDLSTSKETQSWQISNQAYSLCYHPDGTRLAISNHQQTSVVLFDLSAGKPVTQFAHTAGVRGMSWGPRGTLLATASGTRVYIWEVNNPRQPKAILEGHGNTVTHVAFNREGSLLASHGWDLETRFWDPRTATQLFCMPGEMLQFSQFSADDRYLGFKNSAREIGIWEVSPGHELRTLGVAASQSPHILAASFSHDDRLLATASSEGVRLWDLAEHREVLFRSLPGASSAHFAPGDKGLLLAERRGISLWPFERHVESDATRMLVTETPLAVEINSQSLCAQSESGKVVAVVRANQLDVFAVDDAFKFTRFFGGQHPNAGYVAVSPDGRWVATGTWKGTGVKIWNVEAKTLARDLPVQGNAAVGFSPDGKLLGTSTGYDYCLWSVPNWTARPAVTRESGGDVPGAICFSPDGKLWAVLAGRSGGLRLVSTSDNRVLADLESGNQLPLCFSHDGRKLAVRGERGRVLVWDLSLLAEQLQRLMLPVEFDPDSSPRDAAGSHSNGQSAAAPLIVELAPPRGG